VVEVHGLEVAAAEAASVLLLFPSSLEVDPSSYPEAVAPLHPAQMDKDLALAAFVQTQGAPVGASAWDLLRGPSSLEVFRDASYQDTAAVEAFLAPLVPVVQGMNMDKA